MKSLVRILLGLGGFGLLLLVLTPITEHRAEANNPLTVSVNNVPLPVQGTVSVGNMPSVNVANAPSVNVANVPNVNVANSAVPVSGNVAVANTVDQGNNPVPLLVTVRGTPYQDQCETASPGSSCNFNPLPAGTRLVIQEFDLNAVADDISAVFLFTTVNGSTVNHAFLASVQQGDTSPKGWSLHQPTTMYADPGTNITCQVFSPSATGFCSFSGYLVPAQ